MKTIKESIIGSNDVGIKERIEDWYYKLSYEQRRLFKEMDDKIHYQYVGTKLNVDKKFNENFPSWIVFDQPINVVTISNYDEEVLKRLRSIQIKDLFIINYNKSSLTDIPFSSNLYVDNCFNLTSLCPGRSFECLKISKCPKITSLKSVPTSNEIVIDNCDGITNLDGAEDKCKGSISVIECKNLITLEGCPVKVKGDLTITDNQNLVNIESFPGMVVGTVIIKNNGRDFTKDEISGKCRSRKVIV